MVDSHDRDRPARRVSPALASTTVTNGNSERTPTGLSPWPHASSTRLVDPRGECVTRVWQRREDVLLVLDRVRSYSDVWRTSFLPRICTDQQPDPCRQIEQRLTVSLLMNHGRRDANQRSANERERERIIDRYHLYTVDSIYRCFFSSSTRVCTSDRLTGLLRWASSPFPRTYLWLNEFLAEMLGHVILHGIGHLVRT